MIFNRLRKYLLVTLVAMSNIGHSGLLAYHQEDRVRTFYQDPTYEQFLACLSYVDNVFAKAKPDAPDGDVHALNLLLVFLIQAQRNHPEFLAKAMKSPADLPEDCHGLLMVTASHADPDDSRVDAALRKDVLSNPDLGSFPSDFKELTISVPGDLDIFWTCFFATGEDVYVRRILDHLYSKPQILKAAFETFVREDMTEVLQSLRSDYEQLVEFMTVYAGYGLPYPWRRRIQQSCIS